MCMCFGVFVLCVLADVAVLHVGYEQQLQDKFGHLPFDLRKVEPNVDHNPNSLEKCFEVIQESGEVLFVPSGWYHQVFNLVNKIPCINSLSCS